MSYWDYDFYDEPSEFEEQVGEFKKALTESVKKEFLEEMQALKEENERLREFIDKEEDYNRELERIKRDCAIRAENAERDAKRKRLNELLKDVSVFGYRPKYTYEIGPKCDKCDNNRRIHFRSPSGRDLTEDCVCAKRKVTYVPARVSLVEFCATDRFDSVYYERTEESGEYSRYDLIADVFDKSENKSFDDINQYHVVFLNEEDCRRYCEWLNDEQNQH